MSRQAVAELQAVGGGSPANRDHAGATSHETQKHVDTNAHHDVVQRIHQRLQGSNKPGQYQFRLFLADGNSFKEAPSSKTFEITED